MRRADVRAQVEATYQKEEVRINSYLKESITGKTLVEKIEQQDFRSEHLWKVLNEDFTNIKAGVAPELLDQKLKNYEDGLINFSNNFTAFFSLQFNKVKTSNFLAKSLPFEEVPEPQNPEGSTAAYVTFGIEFSSFGLKAMSLLQ